MNHEKLLRRIIANNKMLALGVGDVDQAELDYIDVVRGGVADDPCVSAQYTRTDIHQSSLASARIDDLETMNDALIASNTRLLKLQPDIDRNLSERDKIIDELEVDCDRLINAAFAGRRMNPNKDRVDMAIHVLNQVRDDDGAYKILYEEIKDKLATARNDALEESAIAMGTFHYNRYREDGLSSPAVFTSHTHQGAMECIRALKSDGEW